MVCKRVKALLAPYILGDLADNLKLTGQLEEHLRRCNRCTKEYERYKQTIGFIEENKDIFAEVFEEIDKEKAEKSKSRRLGFCKIYINNGQHTRKLQPLIRITAVAASIAIVFSLFFVNFHQNNRNEPEPPKIVSSETSVKIESLEDNSIIPAGQKISTISSQLINLRLNSKHRLIMNENTSLYINPLVDDENIGCSVQLAAGRIYAYVEHDGNPFVVQTPNGNAFITGTTFDIQATEIETKLIVAEGTVRFESLSESVVVSKGQLSRIVGDFAPTIPSLCDTAELTAWATGYELKSALAKIESISSDYDLTDLWLTASSVEIELENLGYHDWIENKREWFGREFPHVFDLRQALVQAAIKADYPELLFATGDIWQFAYPQVSNQQIPVITLDSLLEAGSQYGFNEQWLLDNIPSAKSLQNNPEQVLTGKDAFTKWAELFENLRSTNKTPGSDMLLYSLHAVTYLTNTRTLAWLYISNETTEISAEDKEQVLDLLQSQVNTSNELTHLVIRLFAASENQPCEEFNVLIEKVIDSLSEIMDIEEKNTGFISWQSN